MSTTEQVIERYYKGWETGNLDEMEAVLATNLKFRGPMEQHNSAKDFMNSCKAMKESGAFDDCKMTLKNKFIDGSEVVFLYELATKDKSVPMAEYHRVQNGKIAEIRLYFDSKKFA